MIIIKSKEAIERANFPVQLEGFIRKLFQNCPILSGAAYNPEHDGYVVVVTPTDTDAKLCEKLGIRWSDNMFEGVSYHQEGFYHAIFIRSNQYVVSAIVPCEARNARMDTAILRRMVQASLDK